jgi:hypothetical protein
LKRDADAALTKVWALTEKVTETEKTNRQLKAYLRSSLQIIKKVSISDFEALRFRERRQQLNEMNY